MEPEKSESGTKIAGERRVGLLFDERMCKHENTRDDYHPETPNRIRAIWDKLQTTGIANRCVILDAKEAEDKHILSVHSKNHVNLIKNISSNSRRLKIASRLSSIYFNEGSSEAAYLAAGSAVEVVERVASRDLHSAVAIVRPPGHHAEHDEAMGFCLFNNVAIAANYLLDERPDLGVKKILIVDWDIHHGNGTQKMFWNDSRVLFFSVHRHEFGSFYPASDDGFYNMIGEGAGAGYTINVPWENGRCGDADYFAVWDHILLPVAKEFNPDIIIVSAGFDAAIGDPLGGCRVTPFGYSVMLKKLMNFAEGRIALVLEGGYNLDSIAKSMHACVEVLLEDKPIIGSSEAYPFESTWRVIQAVRQELSLFWPTLASELPQKLVSLMAPPPHTLVSSSDSETEDDKGRPNLEPPELLQDVIKPLSELTVNAGAVDFLMRVEKKMANKQSTPQFDVDAPRAVKRKKRKVVEVAIGDTSVGFEGVVQPPKIPTPFAPSTQQTEGVNDSVPSSLRPISSGHIASIEPDLLLKDASRFLMEFDGNPGKPIESIYDRRFLNMKHIDCHLSTTADTEMYKKVGLLGLMRAQQAFSLRCASMSRHMEKELQHIGGQLGSTEAHHTEVVKKLKDDHAKVLKKLHDDHAAEVARLTDRIRALEQPEARANMFDEEVERLVSELSDVEKKRKDVEEKLAQKEVELSQTKRGIYRDLPRQFEAGYELAQMHFKHLFSCENLNFDQAGPWHKLVDGVLRAPLYSRKGAHGISS